MPRDGVLIVGFGGPDRPEAVGPFMCNLMGREPSPDLVERVSARYAEIGGCSPLLEIAQNLADSVAVALSGLGRPMPVEVGMRYWEPYIADAIDTLAARGVERLAMVSLSPFTAEVTHGEYRAAVDEALRRHPGMEAFEAPLLSDISEFLELHAHAAAEALAALDHPSATLVFSAHSLPAGDVARDATYVRGLETAAGEIASRLGLPGGAHREVVRGISAFGSAEGPRTWLVAYQSKGARGGEWLGPDVDDVLGAIAAGPDPAAAIVPLGFATDHMETRYDLDVVARRRAEDLGVTFVRSKLPNAHHRLAGGIAQAVAETLPA